jgi:hypothetical protein
VIILSHISYCYCGLRGGGDVQWGIPRDNSRADTKWLAEGVPHASRDLERLPVDLVGPAGVVPQVCNCLGDIHSHAVGVEDSCIDSLETGELLGIAFDQVGELKEESAALWAGGGPPGLEAGGG